MGVMSAKCYWGRAILFFLIIATKIPRNHVKNYTKDHQDHAGTSNIGAPECATRENFNGHWSLNVPKNGIYESVSLTQYQTNYTKYGLFALQIYIKSLVNCGDIEKNPGPVLKNSRKYKLKFPCIVCDGGVNIRKVSCTKCGSVSHIKCVNDLTKESYDNYVSKGETIPLQCRMCINNSNIDNSTVINDHAPILIFHNVQRQATFSYFTDCLQNLRVNFNMFFYLYVPCSMLLTNRHALQSVRHHFDISLQMNKYF